MMNAEDFFIFLLQHALKHHEAGGCGLRTIFDILLVKRRVFGKIDVAALEKRIKELFLWDFYRNACRLEKFWFYGEAANDDVLEFEQYTVNGGVYGTRANFVSKK